MGFADKPYVGEQMKKKVIFLHNIFRFSPYIIMNEFVRHLINFFKKSLSLR